MQTYDLMLESVFDQSISAMRPGLVWVRGPDLLLKVFGTHAYTAEAERYNGVLERARRDGFDEADLWEYWRQEGGNGYGNLRTAPVAVVAATWAEAVERGLARCNQANIL